MALFLRVTDGHLPSQVFRLEDPSRLRIGRRPDSDIPLQDRSVSRQHCVLDILDGRIVVTDTNSRNGVWFGQERRTVGVTGVGGTIRLSTARLDVCAFPGIDAYSFNHSLSPRQIISYLPAQGSSRKLRLIACAWYRHVIGLFAHERLRGLAELAEQHADGLVTDDELSLERDQALQVLSNVTLTAGFEQGPLCLAASGAREVIESLLQALTGFVGISDVEKLMSALARDALGDFFHPFHPAQEWLEWDDGIVGKIARTMYDLRDFTGMPVLADALEEAGCCDEEVLRHCRSEGIHTRGCWVLDSILGPCRPRPPVPGPEMTMTAV